MAKIIELNSPKRRLDFKLEGLLAMRHRAGELMADVIESCQTEQQWERNLPVIKNYQKTIETYDLMIQEKLCNHS